MFSVVFSTTGQVLDTILEALPAFLGACDEAVQKEAWKAFTKTQGLGIRLGVKIEKVTTRKTGVLVEYTDDKGLAQKLECDKLIVSVGRIPNTDGLGADKVGLKLDACSGNFCAAVFVACRSVR